MAGEFNFQESLAEIEKVVSELETGEMPLEQAINKYKAASKLARQALKEIESVKIKVQQVVCEEKGKLKVRQL